jgi:hypothetical protein
MSFVIVLDLAVAKPHCGRDLEVVDWGLSACLRGNPLSWVPGLFTFKVRVDPLAMFGVPAPLAYPLIARLAYL